ncbi:hypothetical protein PVAG01_04163 [Phlyctema vagabunda]|uniref:Zn(2)-C6 fungal-type domain-containing protein n=1 Tax=Phlyctema vagabunda TaxID=108571 RepID=A0ABR4PP40_9HELO
MVYSRYQCQICQFTYSSSSHLRRHEAVHLGTRVFSCHFCDRQFQRSDAARRHSKSCALRDNRPLPEPRQRGKKKQACETCARAKRACDRSMPCGGCQTSQTVCTYYQSQHDISHLQQKQLEVDSAESSDKSLSDTSSSYTCSPAPQTLKPTASSALSSGSKYTRIDVQFLLNYTDPNSGALPDFFGVGGSSLVSPAPFMDTNIPQFSAEFLEDLDNMLQVTAPPNFEACFWEERPEIPSFDGLQARQPQLQARLTELISLLRKLHKSLSVTDNAAQTKIDLTLIDVLFTVDNLLHFTRLYFDNWYPNCPILHQPTFNIETVSLPVLLGVFLIGAAYSSPRDTAALAREYYDLAEEFIFQDLNFVNILRSERGTYSSSQEAFESLQATYLVSVFQNWQSSPISRRRMRTQRYSDIISAARLMDLTSVKNDHVNSPTSQFEMFDWEAYIDAEARVRLMCYIFLVDCQYTIFYRYPPRLMITEMSGDLPSSEEAFSARDGVSCEDLLNSTQRPPPVSLSTCIKSFLHDSSWSPEIHDVLGSLTIISLFTIINAFNSILFMTKQNFLDNNNLQNIRRGLSRWKIIWNLHLGRVTPQQLSKIGFMKNALEFWHLTNIFVKAEQSADTQTVPSTEFDADSMTEVNSLLKQFEGVTIS